jgi:hypothetical protein
VIQLNENPLPESSDIKASLVIDEAKDAELREKLLKLQLRDPPKPIIPKLKIPRESKVPPTPIQRRMARGTFLAIGSLLGSMVLMRVHG